jgi:hypothetical protein
MLDEKQYLSGAFKFAYINHENKENYYPNCILYHENKGIPRCILRVCFSEIRISLYKR